MASFRDLQFDWSMINTDSDNWTEADILDKTDICRSDISPAAGLVPTESLEYRSVCARIRRELNKCESKSEPTLHHRTVDAGIFDSIKAQVL
ncbi:unnamed protein product [Acanthoscelides obtectus]|uniref:Uncharacterized protein n=1 Tax=Acanthoscelides obtectus TaxID=200917 RepID=A0A9P0M2B4_ACAOB|nr:unnamed protein product [Acanthoscelides obtectus]CAK1626958.1 hypothetical protein AOBTE_LOCUS4177 [Acanthoscelides obtectus]